MGIKVEPSDEVTVDGAPILAAKPTTLIMNKPRGVVTTLSDPQRRPTVAKYLPDIGAAVKPVGRLDFDSQGLLIFTNDGELAMRLSHARYGVEKEYLATVQGQPTESELDQLRKGIAILSEEPAHRGKRMMSYKTAPAHVMLVAVDSKADTSRVKIIIHEGRKRQIRLMCQAIGHPVLTLKRTRIGPLVLRDLPAGACRMLGKVEVERLRKLVGLA